MTNDLPVNLKVCLTFMYMCEYFLQRAQWNKKQKQETRIENNCIFVAISQMV